MRSWPSLFPFLFTADLLDWCPPDGSGLQGVYPMSLPWDPRVSPGGGLGRGAKKLKEEGMGMKQGVIPDTRWLEFHREEHWSSAFRDCWPTHCLFVVLYKLNAHFSETTERGLLGFQVSFAPVAACVERATGELLRFLKLERSSEGESGTWEWEPLSFSHLCSP